MDKHIEKKEEICAEKKYPGAAVDAGDDDKVDQKLVEEDMKERNFNPHQEGL